MRTAGKDILVKYQRRWQLLLLLEIFIYAIGTAVLIYFLSLSFVWSLISFLLISGIMALILTPWKVTMKTVSSHLDQNLERVEYSTGLLLLPQEQLSGLARLQQQKVTHKLKEKINQVPPENNLLRSVVLSGLVILLGIMVFHSGAVGNYRNTGPEVDGDEIIVFHPADSISAKVTPPVLEDQKVTINYPAYTGIPSFTTTKMNVEAVEGSRVTWKIQFEGEVDSVQMESMGNRYPMTFQENTFNRTSVLNSSGFYNFRFRDTTGGSYVSDLYSIEVIRDRDPGIEVPNLQQFTSFDFDEEKNISFNALITDDFGIADAYIIATVSKGTGESVKFREEKLEFGRDITRGSKNQDLTKKINLDNMKMEPGDELYFYIEASDLKQPSPNIARSETYFAVIKDTVSYGAGVEGTLGVDLMPDYFRSQRQLIIDTEKLISNRNKIPAKKFNSTSNELGFDQKALRLKYGKFMGDESEGGLDIQNEPQQAGEENEDPLAEYTHDHDGNNEHNLVEHDHLEEKEGEEPGDPLAEYLHNHSDPESSTLFTDSLRSKLRQALSIMWDAELHLRLYKPEESLPYQYRALALIQEIKNSARIYVHRIGYDPAPIKEEVRLTGKIDEVSNFLKVEELEKPEKYISMRKAVQRLENLLGQKTEISTRDKELFESAANELAALAIEEPGKHLNTLQKLKWLTEERPAKREEMIEVQRGLLKALPKPEAEPGKTKKFTGELNNLLLKELELHDQ